MKEPGTHNTDHIQITLHQKYFKSIKSTLNINKVSNYKIPNMFLGNKMSKFG